MDPILKAIDDALKNKGLSDAAASQLAVKHPSLIKNFRIKRTGEKRYNVAALQKLAEVLDLEFYFGPPRHEPIAPEIKIADSEFAAIAVQSAYASAGPGAVNMQEDPLGELAFRKTWLNAMGINPGRALIVRVRGTSMEPTIRNGSIALIDEQRSDYRNGKIYAFVEGDELRIKRLQIDNGKSIALISDNRDFPVEVRTGIDMNAMRPLGEVVWTAYNWLEEGSGVVRQ